MRTDCFKHLDRVNSPEDLKNKSPEELRDLARELRQFIIEQLAENPGHLGSSLGVVELTVALHYILDTPHDKIIWDVGHQAYAHKILTGRRDRFSTNRKLGGISGFPRMEESEYDSFGGGHSSVSVSAAFGIAEASRLQGIDRKVVAVIGDGAMTGGLSFEGLNNAGATSTDLLVILNDNNMSIDPNVGALKNYLLSITTSRKYNEFKNRIWKLLAPFPRFRRLIQNAGNAMKQGLLQQSNLFESLNFRYFGPVDGHDIKSLIRVLNDLNHIPGPKLLHVLTVKGKGYTPAENNKSIWHAPGRFDPDTGERVSGDTTKPLYQDVFGEALLELAKINDKIVGITPAMPTGCSMNIMMKQMPERCFDVGIAEGHAVTFSAGMAAAGMLPFCNIYSSFMQRAYDNVIHDVALQQLPVVMCLDRAGLVGEDGATHHGAFDIAFLRPIPDIIISSPLNECDLRNLMYTAQEIRSPFFIRYPRGRGEGVACTEGFDLLPVGKGRRLRTGRDLAVISFGPVGNRVAEAIDRAEKEGLSVEHIDLLYIKPLDENLLHETANKFSRIITVEDGVMTGGVASAIADFMARNNYHPTIRSLGIGDQFIEHGTQEQLYEACGYDREAIYEAIRSMG